MPITNDIQISALQARLIAQFNLISSPEKVESQIKESCSVVVDDSKSEGQRIYAASVREVCAIALANAFAVTAAREGIGRRRQKVINDTTNQNTASSKLPMVSLGNSQFQKQISQQPVNQLRANDSGILESGKIHIEQDWSQELYSNCIAELLRTLDDSSSSSHFILNRMLIQNFDWKHPYLIQLTIHAIPRLAALEVPSQYIKQSLDFLHRCIKKEKPLSYITMGFIAHIAPGEFEKNEFLEKTITAIKLNLPGKDISTKKRQPLLEVSIYMLIGLIATGFKNKVHVVIKEMIGTMVEVGLSFPLIYSLKMGTLLKSLRKTLMNNSRTEPKKAQYSTSISLENETLLCNGLLSPLVAANLSVDQIEARNKIIALRTLVEFDFDKHNLSLFVRFISSKLISFITCSYKEVRLEAVKTCAQLLTPLLGANDDEGSFSDRNTLTAVADVLEKLLIVSTSDPAFLERDVRLCVFQSFDERFDAYLAQECHLSPLFVAFYDEMFEIRKLVIRCLGRLSAINPSCLKPNLRKILLQTLTELEFSGSSRNKEQAAQILAELIDTAPGFVQSHSEKLLLVLLPRIQSIICAAKSQPDGKSTENFNVKATHIIGKGYKISTSSIMIPIYRKGSIDIVDNLVATNPIVEPTAVQLAVIQAIKNLAVVCGSKLRKHLGDLVPALIYMMQDSTSLDKRFVAVTTLSKLVTHTGYVVEPYRKHPELLRLLLMMLRTEEVGSIRREVIKLLGTIGALDPFKQKKFCSELDSVNDVGLVVSMHETIEKKEVDMSQAELLVNTQWKILDDFYTACALQSLTQLLRDPTYRSNYDRICMVIISIFKYLGPNSVQYLKQVLPEYFRCIMEAQDNRHQQTFLSQLCIITDVVKLHLKQFMPQLIEILLQLWNKSDKLTLVCIQLLKSLNIGLGADIKPFLSPLMGVFQQTLVDALEGSVRSILELLPEFEYSIEEHVHILLPSIIKIISKENLGSTLQIKKAALDCLTRLAETLDLSDSAGRIVQPVCRLLDFSEPSTAYTTQLSSSLQGVATTNLSNEQLSELIPPAFDLLTTLLVKMRRRFMVLTPLIQKTLENIKYHFPAGTTQSMSFARFNTALNKIYQISAGRIVQPVCRLLDFSEPSTAYTTQLSSSLQGVATTNLSNEQLSELIPPAFDLLTTLLVKMRRRFMVLTPLIQKTLENIKYHFPAGTTQSMSFARFNTALNKVLKISYISNHEDNLDQFESFARRKRLENSSTYVPNILDISQTSMTQEINSVNLQKAWAAKKMISSDDWIQWLKNFSISLVKESPSNAIRSCSNLGGCTGVLSKALFNASFVSCWPELTDTQQDNLIATLESILNECPSTEVSQAVLNLEEFMTHCERMKLPIATSALASRALKNRVYAKALYYKEQEFLEETAKKGSAPQNILFDLLTINNKLQLEEAASGVVLYATKVYRDKLQNEERWHEILQDWTKALNLYQRKLEDNDSRRVQNNELTLGRMRCLQALGDWSSLKNIGIDRFDQVDDSIKTKMAPIIVNAAWALGDFNTMNKYVESIPLNNFEGPFLRAVIAIQHEEFHEASEYIQKARDELDSCLTAMAGESYIRAYGDLVEAQKLAELEEVIQYKLVRESQETIRQAWIDRLKGCQQVIDDWRQLLQIRSLVLTPNQDMTTWLKFAGLARRSNRLMFNLRKSGGLPKTENLVKGLKLAVLFEATKSRILLRHEMSKSIMDRLYGSELSKISKNNILNCQFPQIIFSWSKYQWTTGQHQMALGNLELLVEQKLKNDIIIMTERINNIQIVDESCVKNSRILLAKCALRLGDWYTESLAKETDALYRIVSTYRIATEEAPGTKRAWQAWAMANYAIICMSKNRIVELTRQMSVIARRWKQLQHQEVTDTRRSSLTQGFNTNSQIVNQNNGSTVMSSEVARISQPQLRFSLLQSQQKRGCNLVSFPSTVPHVPESLATFGQAVAVRQPDNENLSTATIESNDSPNDLIMLENQYRLLDKQRKALIVEREAYSHPAVRGFVNAISLSPTANLQDSLRLVILLFQFDHISRIREVICDGLSKISLENWLLVIQQLLARIDTHKEHVSSIIVGLLITVGERHPQAMVNPLVLAFKSGGSDRRRYNANKILHSMEVHSARLVSEAFLLNEELIRLGISWMEMWTECLEDASRLHYEEKNTTAMFKILYPLHILMEREIETHHEVAFYNEYYGDLSSAKNLCIRYESSNYKTDLTQAWEIYSNLYRKWSKQISNVSTLELSVASPRLHDYNDWILAIPGSYDPNRPIVKINSIKNCLNLMTSKQHPRKLTIIGDDGHNYMFLLKGHEDIRQDERAMQFFGLINTLMVSNRQTSRINLSIQRMSVIPLSTNTGLIGWVPNSDTLNAVIRDYREKTQVLLNREHKEMLKIAPDFEKLNIIQKTEVFESGIRESDGKDLAHILWLKSHNSEAWFERRTNFIRSLAVMSMVGYILGLGDRHPSNIMLCRDSGKVIHIDFGDCFEVATMREKYPEKVPFRLTRMLIGAMEVTGIEGLFRHTSIQIVNLMRKNRESLLAVLEAFLHDPLLQWVLHDNTKKGGENTVETDDSLSANIDAINELRKALQLHVNPNNVPTTSVQFTNVPRNHSSRPSSGNIPHMPDNIRIFTDNNYPDSKTLRNPYSVNQWRHHLCNGPWFGCYNTVSLITESDSNQRIYDILTLKMRKRATDGSIIVERNGLEGLIFSAKSPISDRPNYDDTEDEWAGANMRAMDVMKHIKNKLEGKEVGGNLTSEEHVDMLVKQATCNYNLCQMYFGWCAFW
uniref:Serine/threonine-protein kinase TOR n=1 Tax=Schmidtea mediterranea TaxID=79327 RepID=H9XVZ6_SCHMD|nr:Tor [Schmidtea mediterranea]